MTNKMAKSSGMKIASQQTVKSLLKSDSISGRIKNMLGKRAAQFTSSLISLSREKALAKCDGMSVVQAGMVAATLDLPINPTFGFAYVVPYKGKAQFQIGYKGLVQLAQRSGQYKHLNSFIVYEGDKLDFDPVTSVISLKRNGGIERKVVGYGAYMKTTSGFEHAVYWTKEEVEAHAKKFSQAYRSGYDTPWKSDFDAMAQKTVLKNMLTHWGPLSVEVQNAVSRDGTIQESPEHEPMFEDAIDTESEEVADQEPDNVTEIPQDTETKPEPEKKAKAKAKPKPKEDAPAPVEDKHAGSRIAVMKMLEANSIPESELCRWAEEFNIDAKKLSEIPGHMLKSIADGPEIWIEEYRVWLKEKPLPGAESE